MQKKPRYDFSSRGWVGCVSSGAYFFGKGRVFTQSAIAKATWLAKVLEDEGVPLRPLLCVRLGFCNRSFLLVADQWDQALQPCGLASRALSSRSAVKVCAGKIIKLPSSYTPMVVRYADKADFRRLPIYNCRQAFRGVSHDPSHCPHKIQIGNQRGQNQ